MHRENCGGIILWSNREFKKHLISMGRGGGLGVGLGLRGATAFLEGEGPGGGMAYSFIATLTNWPYYGLK